MALPHSTPLIVSLKSSASSLVALQLFSRLFTFILNQGLLRLASPSAYGAATVQFELILSTILFLSREGVRNTLLRMDIKRGTAAQLNLAFLPVAMGLPLAFATTYLYWKYASQETRMQPHFTAAIAMYAGAALVELWSEPMHNKAMSELNVSVRVRAEGMGITCKSIVAFLVLLYDAQRDLQGDLSLLAFAGGQVVYGCVVLLAYISSYGPRILVPNLSHCERGKDGFLDLKLLRLSLTMTSQSLLKHILTEGDKLLLSLFSPLQDQGGYAIAVNYGSLVARIVFQPIEETLRAYFSKIFGNENEAPSLNQAATAIVSLLSVQTAFSLIFVVFGSSYLSVALPILLPQQYLSTSAPHVLAAWVWYVPALALNGGLEAFLAGVASPQDLNRQSRWMIGFSVIFIMSASVAYNLNLGDTSLVYANVVNLSARIVYSLNFVNAFFAVRGLSHAITWQGVIPSRQLWLMAALSKVLIEFSERALKVDSIVQNKGRLSLLNAAVALHVCFGLVLFLSCGLAWWLSSGRYLVPLRKVKTS